MSDTKSLHPSPISEGEIEELKRLLEKATPGPWYQTGSPWFQDGSGVLAGNPDPHVAPLIVDCESWGGEREEQQRDHPDVKMADPDDDAALIVAMRNALPRLLSALSRCGRDEALIAMEARKDAAYLERNQVVAALASAFPSGIKRTEIPGWSEDWHGCVYIDLPTGQASWHYHDSHAHLFAHLPPYKGQWDGHTTDEKYERLRSLVSDDKERGSVAGAAPFDRGQSTLTASDGAKAVTCKALCRNHLSGFAEPCAEACITGAGVAFDCEHATVVWSDDAQRVLDALSAIPAETDSAMLAALEGVVRVADRKTVEFDAARAAIAAAKVANLKGQ